jgi:hypothetical protein
LKGLVSSHADLPPDNILFDGRRLWLIDWESPCRNGAMVDLATVIDVFEFPLERKSVLVTRCLGRSPGAAFYRQMTTGRILTRLYVAGVFLSSAATSCARTAPDIDLSVPSCHTYSKSVCERPLRGRYL